MAWAGPQFHGKRNGPPRPVREIVPESGEKRRIRSLGSGRIPSILHGPGVNPASHHCRGAGYSQDAADDGPPEPQVRVPAPPGPGGTHERKGNQDRIADSDDDSDQELHHSQGDGSMAPGRPGRWTLIYRPRNTGQGRRRALKDRNVQEGGRRRTGIMVEPRRRHAEPASWSGPGGVTPSRHRNGPGLVSAPTRAPWPGEPEEGIDEGRGHIAG